MAGAQTILKFKAVNIKNISQLEIDTGGNPVVRVVGKNATGKTSVIDSVAMLLGGADNIPGKPIREGATKSSIVAHTQDYIIERVITNKGTSLHVKSAAGEKIKAPQALLDSLLNNVEFDDPLALIRKKPKEQVEILKDVAGLDFTQIDIDRDGAYSKRTDINRKAVELKAQIEHAEFFESDDIPDEEISMESVLTELNEAEAFNLSIDSQKQALSDSVEEVRAYGAVIDSEKTFIKEKTIEIEKLKKEIKKAEENIFNDMKKIDVTDKIIDGLEKDIAKYVYVDRTAIQQKMTDLEGINRKVRSNKEYLSLKENLKLVSNASDEATEKISSLDQQKKTMLENAKFPVPGLSFTDENVIFNGIPFDQSSTAEQLRVGVAIGLAMNPQLRVILIRDGSLLDNDSMKILAEMIKENDAQVWIEQVSNDDNVKIIIE